MFVLIIHSFTDESKTEIYKTLISYVMEGGGYGGKKDKLVPVTNRDPHITGITSQSYSTVPKQDSIPEKI